MLDQMAQSFNSLFCRSHIGLWFKERYVQPRIAILSNTATITTMLVTALLQIIDQMFA